MTGLGQRNVTTNIPEVIAAFIISYLHIYDIKMEFKYLLQHSHRQNSFIPIRSFQNIITLNFLYLNINVEFMSHYLDFFPVPM